MTHKWNRNYVINYRTKPDWTGQGSRGRNRKVYFKFTYCSRVTSSVDQHSTVQKLRGSVRTYLIVFLFVFIPSHFQFSVSTHVWRCMHYYALARAPTTFIWILGFQWTALKFMRPITALVMKFRLYLARHCIVIIFDLHFSVILNFNKALLTSVEFQNWDKWNILWFSSDPPWLRAVAIY